MSPWSITSSTIDGGGNRSTGSVWTLTGTIGQPDAAPQAQGGTLAAQGGFWPGVVSVPGGPALIVTRTGPTLVQIAWTAEAVGNKLQYSYDLVLWNDYQGSPITGASFIPWSLGNDPRCFFRLKKL